MTFLVFNICLRDELVLYKSVFSDRSCREDQSSLVKLSSEVKSDRNFTE